MTTKTAFKTSLFALTFAAANAFAFYGTEIRNYRANPWLDGAAASTAAAKTAAAPAGATGRPADAKQQSTNAPLERFFEQANRASQLGGN